MQYIISRWEKVSMRPNSRWENQVCLRNITWSWGKINYIFDVFYPKQLPMLFIPALSPCNVRYLPTWNWKMFCKKGTNFHYVSISSNTKGWYKVGLIKLILMSQRLKPNNFKKQHSLSSFFLTYRFKMVMEYSTG